MTPERWQKVKDICFAVLDRDADEREALLQELCAGVDGLRHDVDVMIADACSEESVAARASGRTAIAAGAMQFAAATAGTADWKPDVIGAFRILHVVGEGGLGVVYEARQQEPSRIVALKVIRPGLTTPEVLRRFRQEAHALARLQHPGIAQIYEAGTAETPFGPQPYFAMEFIRGESLRTYVERHKPGVAERLELVARICDAVQHAHQRGLIHRDLKPSNILIDDSGQPKVLDFGVARLTDGDVHATQQTDLGQLVGTLAYMSPEQVLADPLELDTRSDVYALGVILYELLAGRLPYTISTRIPEAVRTIQHEDPQRLSSISRAYRGDLETIAAKALEKDKTRRFGSAAALAADIRRYLQNEPISARPASATYQLRKFARRHRALVAGIAAVVLALAAGIVATTREAIRARRAERAADEQAAEAGDQRRRAEAQALISDTERKRAQAEQARASAAATVASAERARAEERLQDIRRLTGSFLFEFHDGIRDLPGSMAARELVVKRALEYLDRLSREPDQSVDLRRELGSAYLRTADIQGNPFLPSLGRSADALVSYGKARTIFESIARDSPNHRSRALDTIASVSDRMAQIMARMGNTAGGLDEERRAERIWTRLAKEQPENLPLQRNLSVTHQVLGDFLLRLGDTSGALREYRTMQQNCLRLLARHPSSSEYRRDLTYSHQKIGDLLFFRRSDLDGALAEYQKMLMIRRELVAEHPNNFIFQRDLLMSLERVGGTTMKKGDYPIALEHLGQSERIARELIAADLKNVVVKRDLMSILGNVAEAQQRAGSLDAAERTMREAITTARDLLAINPKAAQYRADLAELESKHGEILVQKGDLAAASASYDVSRATLEGLAAEDAQSVAHKEALAAVYQALGDLARKQDPGASDACARYRQASELFASVGTRMSEEHVKTSKQLEQSLKEACPGGGDARREAAVETASPLMSQARRELVAGAQTLFGQSNAAGRGRHGSTGQGTPDTLLPPLAPSASPKHPTPPGQSTIRAHTPVEHSNAAGRGRHGSPGQDRMDRSRPPLGPPAAAKQPEPPPQAADGTQTPFPQVNTVGFEPHGSSGQTPTASRPPVGPSTAA